MVHGGSVAAADEQIIMSKIWRMVQPPVEFYVILFFRRNRVKESSIGMAHTKHRSAT